MNLSERKLKERKVRQELILGGALEVFKEKGIEGSTMDEIALASGFGKATLYYYFKSKEEVFAAILSNGWKCRSTETKNIDYPRNRETSTWTSGLPSR